jgi:hypothetical protein
MKRWILILLIVPFALYGQSLTSTLKKNIPGEFQLSERGDGTFFADYTRGNLDVQMLFPGKPQIGKDRATYLQRPPLVQLSFMVLTHEDMRAELQAKVVLNSVKNEYDKLRLAIKDVKQSERKRVSSGGNQGESFQYIIDLENGIREFLTVQVFTQDDWDIVPFTRVILSPQETKDMSARIKGNSEAANFFETIQIQ